MRAHRIHKTRTYRRGGLAPLELVLNLPIWLMVMALMVIVGHAGVWKARAHTSARQAVWRTLFPRTGGGDPFPRGWNNDYARMGAGGSQPPVIEYDPFRPFDVVRGPRYTEPASGKSLPVRPYQFDARLGLLEGSSQYDGPWPFLRGMPPGRYRIHREHPILDDRWQFDEQGMGSNRRRRLLFLYPFDLRRHEPSKVQRYTQAAIAIILNPMRSQLDPLDVAPDGEQLWNYHWTQFGLDGEYGNRDGLANQLRNPKLVCSYDTSELKSKVVDQLIEEVQGTDMRPRNPYEDKWGRPGRMTHDYLQYYEQLKSRYERELEGIPDQIQSLQDQIRQIPGNDPASQQQRALLQQQIDALEQRQQSLPGQIAVLDEYISQLEDFRDEVLTP